MSDEEEDKNGDGAAQSLLSRISKEMVRAQKQFFGKGPTQAKSYFLDDMLIVVMRGGLTTAEQTMLQFGQPDQVRRFRQLFENAMTGRLTSMVEELTGRKVATYQSQIMFDPDVVVEMFVFEQPGEARESTAAAQGQVEHEDVGQAADSDALDAPLGPGR